MNAKSLTVITTGAEWVTFRSKAREDSETAVIRLLRGEEGVFVTLHPNGLQDAHFNNPANGKRVKLLGFPERWGDMKKRYSAALEGTQATAVSDAPAAPARAAKRTKAAGQLTIGQMFDEWVSGRGKVESNYRGFWRKHLAARLDNKPAAAVVDLLPRAFGAAIDAGCPKTVAQRLLTFFRPMLQAAAFMHPEERQALAAQLAILPKPSAFADYIKLPVLKEKPGIKNTLLTVSDAVQLYRELPVFGAPIAETWASGKPRRGTTEFRMVGELLRWIMLTGCRKTEARMLEWSDIRFDEGRVLIPAAKMKMKRPHSIPLSDDMLDVLRRLPGFETRQGYVFSRDSTLANVVAMNTPNATLAAMGVQAWAKDENGLPVAVTATPHDLRRSFSVFACRDAGVSPDVADLMLAHSKQGVIQQTYQPAEEVQIAALADGWREMARWWHRQLEEQTVTGV